MFFRALGVRARRLIRNVRRNGTYGHFVAHSSSCWSCVHRYESGLSAKYRPESSAFVSGSGTRCILYGPRHDDRFLRSGAFYSGLLGGWEGTDDVSCTDVPWCLHPDQSHSCISGRPFLPKKVEPVSFTSPNQITAANAGKRLGFAGRSRVGLSPRPGVAEFCRSLRREVASTTAERGLFLTQPCLSRQVFYGSRRLVGGANHCQGSGASQTM